MDGTNQPKILSKLYSCHTLIKYLWYSLYNSTRRAKLSDNTVLLNYSWTVNELIMNQLYPIVHSSGVNVELIRACCWGESHAKSRLPWLANMYYACMADASLLLQYSMCASLVLAVLSPMHVQAHCTQVLVVVQVSSS